ncbi:hypothetical protein GGI15_001580 [Coemansia interrupta]|uniref:Uncharacterized protein n=1 Tax=Coemansia interrupta TaxID=1126814 RepID=A0A9W8HMJ8_9FUNG|nr:hypothetical protein GGI15_001580 [Coemansia interrupta]
MTDTSPSPIQLTPSPNIGHARRATEGVFGSVSGQQRQPTARHQSAQTTLTRHQSISGGVGKPSPYSPKVQGDLGDSTRAGRAGIGGPVKRRESMSGIGNNLRSHKPAGLGRSVGKIPVQQQVHSSEYRPTEDQQQPSGLSNLLRGQSRGAPTLTNPFSPAPVAAPADDAGALPPMQRRGSSGTSSTVAADTSKRDAGPTVFPTNRGYAPRSFAETSRHPLQRRATSISVRYAGPRDRHSSSPQSQAAGISQAMGATQSPAAISNIDSQGAGNSPLNVRVVHRSHSVSHRDRNNSLRSPRSPLMPTTMGMAIGSPQGGDIIDIVGSPARPSVVFAQKHRSSGIGGSYEGKSLMQERVGLGGKKSASPAAEEDPANM